MSRGCVSMQSGPHHLQGARLPHSPLKDTFVYKRIPLLSGCIVNMQQGCFLVDTSQGRVFIEDTVPPCEEHICSLHGELMRQPAKVLFLCAEMIYGTHKNPLRLRTVDS